MQGRRGSPMIGGASAHTPRVARAEPTPFPYRGQRGQRGDSPRRSAPHTLARARGDKQIGKGVRGLLASFGEHSQKGEKGLRVAKRDALSLPCIPDGPAESGTVVLLGGSVADEEDELKGFHEPDVREVTRCRDKVAPVECATESSVGRALRGHEQMFARPRTSVERLAAWRRPTLACYQLFPFTSSSRCAPSRASLRLSPRPRSPAPTPSTAPTALRISLPRCAADARGRR
jgi:hypothetical protein